MHLCFISFYYCAYVTSVVMRCGINSSRSYGNSSCCDRCCLAFSLLVFTLIQDSFTRCFKSNSPEPWNWNIYLFPLWCLGVVIRYGILFPLRGLTLLVGWLAFFAAFFPVHFLLKGQKMRSKIEVTYLISHLCQFLVVDVCMFICSHNMS
jgi:hypothetical protein